MSNRLRREDIHGLVDDLTSFEFDPIGFVLWAFPWGEPGTPLEKEPGPEDWQLVHLNDIAQGLVAGGDEGAVVETDTPAGHGVGKSACVAWIILWAISTKAKTRGVVTANTEKQLRTKTWAELGKWYEMFIARELFDLQATSISAVQEQHAKTWRIDAVPWSKQTAEAFAGLHNKGLRQIMVFDEASAIDDAIWESADGFLTDKHTQILWLRYGNPTRTSGRFFGNTMKIKNNIVRRIDSRTTRLSNLSQIDAWIKEYGEDSDFVRVRVKGQAPRAGTTNFIAYELPEKARYRKLEVYEYSAFQLVLSVDPARFGDDKTVITLRQGRKVHWQRKMSGYDGIDVAGRVQEICREVPGIVAIVYDANGNGADLDSALRRITGLPALVPVMWGIPARDTKKYFNLRAECWGMMRDWLKDADIPDDDELCNELTSLDYGYDLLFRIQLQSKKDIKRNGGKSPDCADSLAMSFLVDTLDMKSVSVRARPVTRRSPGGWT